VTVDRQLDSLVVALRRYRYRIIPDDAAAERW